MGAGESKFEILDNESPAAAPFTASQYERTRLIGSLKYLDPRRFAIKDWRNGLADAFGFCEAPLQCSGRLERECTDGFCVRKQRLVTAGNSSAPGAYRFNPRSRASKVATYLEYHHLPAHVSAVENFRVHRVVCERGGLAVLHLVREGTNRFALVSLHSRRFLGTFGNYYSRRHAVTFRGRISSDGRYLLVAFANDGGRHCLHLYALVEKAQSVVGELVLGEGQAVLDMAFDPRSIHAVVTLVTREGDRIAVTTRRTADWSAVASAYEQTVSHAFLAAISYAPCGTRLVLQLVQHDETLCRSEKLQMVRVLDSDSLRPLGKAIVHQARSADGEALTACIAHSCSTNYRPVFSRCGGVVALPSLDAPATELRVFRIPPPLDLRHLCRQLVRQCCKDVTGLPVPPAVMAYLRFDTSGITG